MYQALCMSRRQLQPDHCNCMRLDQCTQKQSYTSLQNPRYRVGRQCICRLRTRSDRLDKQRTQHHLMFVQTGRVGTCRNLVFARLDNHCTCRRRKTCRRGKARMHLQRLFVHRDMVCRLRVGAHGLSDRHTVPLILQCIRNLHSQFRHGTGCQDTRWRILQMSIDR